MKSVRLPRSVPSFTTLALSLTLVAGACSDDPASPDAVEAEPVGTLHGRVVAPGISTFSDLTARLSWGNWTFEAAVLTDGTFDIVVTEDVAGLGTLTVEPGVFAPLHPGWALVSRHDVVEMHAPHLGTVIPRALASAG